MANIDFYSFRDTLLAQLAESDVFSGYDPRGRALSVIVDLLSKDAEFIGMYLNMSATERNISTAQIRHNIIAAMTRNGLVPRIYKAASATGKVTVQSAVSSIFYPGSYIKASGRTFYTTSFFRPVAYTAGQGYSYNPTGYAGVLEKYSFYVANGAFDRYIIKRRNVDISSISVFVHDKNTVVSYQSEMKLVVKSVDTLSFIDNQDSYKVVWTSNEYPEIVFVNEPGAGKIVTVYFVTIPDDFKDVDISTVNDPNTCLAKIADSNAGALTGLVDPNLVVSQSSEKLSDEYLKALAYYTTQSCQLLELEQYVSAIKEHFGVKYVKAYRTPNRTAHVTVVPFIENIEASPGISNAIKHYLEQRNAGVAVSVGTPDVWTIGATAYFKSPMSAEVPDDIQYIIDTNDRMLDTLSNGLGVSSFSLSHFPCARKNISAVTVDSITIKRPNLNKKFEFEFISLTLDNVWTGSYYVNAYSENALLFTVVNGIKTAIGVISDHYVKIFDKYSVTDQTVLTIHDVKSDVITGDMSTMFKFEVIQG